MPADRDKKPEEIADMELTGCVQCYNEREKGKKFCPAHDLELLAIAEHDRIFPPRRGDESSEGFLHRSLAEHSNSHMQWVEWYEKHPDSQRGLDDGHTKEYQERCVWRYNQMFEAFNEMLQQKREAFSLGRESAAKVIDTYVNLAGDAETAVAVRAAAAIRRGEESQS